MGIAITAAYRCLALKKHLDKDAGNPNATAEFQPLQDVYETLGNPEKRIAYDAKYHAKHQPYNGHSPPKKTPNFASATPRNHGTRRTPLTIDGHIRRAVD